MATQNQDRLRTHFASLATSSHASGWDSLWENEAFIPWDRGYANPALIDLLNDPAAPPTSTTPNPTPAAPAPDHVPGSISLPAPLKSDGSRRKVLVPGCGRGFDVVLFASRGYDAVGLEVSRNAADAARKYFAEPGDGPLEGEYKIQNESIGKGKTEVVEGDYFDDAWRKGGAEGQFDIVYDNTFLCALPPDARPQWAKRTASLLAPDGALICLEFPTHKPAVSQGPPWSLPPTVHAELLKRPGENITYDDAGVVVATDREESADALVRLAHYVPRRTHGVGVINGVVRDCVSVWRHKS